MNPDDKKDPEVTPEKEKGTPIQEPEKAPEEHKEPEAEKSIYEKILASAKDQAALSLLISDLAAKDKADKKTYDEAKAADEAIKAENAKLKDANAKLVSRLGIDTTPERVHQEVQKKTEPERVNSIEEFVKSLKKDGN